MKLNWAAKIFDNGDKAAKCSFSLFIKKINLINSRKPYYIAIIFQRVILYTQYIWQNAN